MDLQKGEKPILCEICDKTFSNESYLSDHMAIHRDNNSENYRYNTEEEPRPNDNDFARHNYTHLISINNQFRDNINKLLLSMNLPLECGRVVNTSGSCFYDSVLANIENPVIKQSIAFNARNVTSIQDLRLSLANFMEVNAMLHGLEQFQVQRDFTLTDKKQTWTRYLATIRDPYGWADELVVMCMALFLGKDIMQFSDRSVKTKPWSRIPGQVDGWPFPVTTHSSQCCFPMLNFEKKYRSETLNGPIRVHPYDT